MDFNLQNFLSEMRAEQRDDNMTLTAKVDQGFQAVASSQKAHELSDQQMFSSFDKRLSTVENTRRTMRWLAGSITVAALGAGVDLVLTHIPQWFAHKP